MIQNLIFGILFSKILFQARNFFIFLQTFQWTSEIFYQKVLKPTKTSKKDHSFYNKVLLKKTSLILRTSTHLTLKIIGSRNIAKNLSDFTNFSANMFLFSFRKKICTAPFLDAQKMHS